MKNPNIEVINYEVDEEEKAAASEASVFKFFWKAKGSKNPISSAKITSEKLYKEFEHICRSKIHSFVSKMHSSIFRNAFGQGTSSLDSIEKL